MNEKLFWKIIGESKESGLEQIALRLSEIDRGDILKFYNILTALLAKACNFPLLAANFVIESYVSDDGFRTFRAWLVLQGYEIFTKAVADPDSIPDWLDENAIDDIEDGKYLLSVAEDAYEGDDFFERVVVALEPELDLQWPENKNEYRKQWPKLVDKFWNQKLIDEMH